MKKALCFICQRQDRKVKYISSRIQICQWCVTTLLKISQPQDKKRANLYHRACMFKIITGDVKEGRLGGAAAPALRTKVKTQDGYRCMLCGKPSRNTELHVHHIIPLDKFGTNHPNNLITLCYSCHNKQHPEWRVTKNYRDRRTGGEFIAVDIKTTGFSVRNDEIIDLAAVRFKSGTQVNIFSTLIRPWKHISPNAFYLTGIDNEMVNGHPIIDDIFEGFVDYLGTHKIVVSNTFSKMKFLYCFAEILGYDIENEIVDTLTLREEKLPFLKNHRLKTVAEYFQIPWHGKGRALDSCFIVAQVYIECLNTKKPKK